MARVLILGAGGMAGHVMATYLGERGHAIAAAARQPLPRQVAAENVLFDAEKVGALSALVERVRPDAVVNCIGVLVKESERDPARAIRMNALLPRQVAELGAEIGYRTLHISTDCVFSGRRGRYQEHDERDGTDVYAKTKSLGELDDGRNLTLRTSIIGPEIKAEGSGLFDWFMRQRGPVNGFTKAIWGGVTTLELAKVVDAVLGTPLAGIAHVTNGAGISKYELLSMIARVWQREDIDIVPLDEPSIDKSIVSSREDLPFAVPGYEAMLAELRDFMESHKDLYGKYYETTRRN